ncbi:MAG: hypothetical protein WC593_13395 [Methanoregula sp.]
MTSRRCALMEDVAREQLQLHGYSVRILPPGFLKLEPPAHLIATLPSGEMRLIRLWKITNQPSTIIDIERKYRVSIRLFRRHMSGHVPASERHYEIWIYTISYGFRCFEVLEHYIREIPKFPTNDPTVTVPGGVA